MSLHSRVDRICKIGAACGVAAAIVAWIDPSLAAAALVAITFVSGAVVCAVYLATAAVREQWEGYSFRGESKRNEHAYMVVCEGFDEATNPGLDTTYEERQDIRARVAGRVMDILA